MELPFITDRESIRSQMEHLSFSGVLLLAQGANTLVHQERGSRRLPDGPPIQFDSQFVIGSLGKIFTAVAILQLVQQGRLQLEQTVGQLLPNYPNGEAHPISVHQLLTHTGGLGDVFGPEFLLHRQCLNTPQDFLDLFGSQQLLFAPGTRHSYSNLGYMLLGRIIERLAKEPFDHYVQQHIFGPAMMTSSGFDLAEATRLAIGYTESDQGLVPNVDSIPVRGTPTGGCFSTAADLLQFARALMGHHLLGASPTVLMTTGKVQTSDQQLYAYGCRDRSIRGVRWFGHSGGGVGTNTTLRMFPDTEAVLVVLSNRSPPMADCLADFLMGGPSDR